MSLRLRADKVTRSYDGRLVLKGCSVHFRRGVYALMGPNGAGKSTLLRICALLEQPDHGRVLYRDKSHEVQRDIELRRRITLVLPRAGIFNASVFRNVVYGLKVRGVDKKKAARRAHEALDTVGLSALCRQNALTISSGETQRLALARAMVLAPEVLFLDEPTSSVDEENTAIIEGLIKDMRAAGSPTVIFTTHDSAQARRLADEIIRMKNGAIVPARRRVTEK